MKKFKNPKSNLNYLKQFNLFIFINDKIDKNKHY